MPDQPEPCETCGSRVRTRRRRLEGSLAGEVVDERICTNPACPMNTGEASLGDRV